jgi:hypothetical protein
MTRTLAFMTTLQDFQAWSSTCRLSLSTFYRRVDFCDPARTEQGFSRINLARFAEANVTEIVALMHSTRKSLVAGDQAHVETLRVGFALFNGTAFFFALVFFA